MSNVLLIIGGQNQSKARAARVAAQIADQHHGAAVKVLGLDPAQSARLIKPAPGLGRKQLVVAIKGAANSPNIRARRVINLDRFPRPEGRAVTFAIREAVDACLAAR